MSQILTLPSTGYSLKSVHDICIQCYGTKKGTNKEKFQRNADFEFIIRLHTLFSAKIYCMLISLYGQFKL